MRNIRAASGDRHVKKARKRSRSSSESVIASSSNFGYDPGLVRPRVQLDQIRGLLASYRN
jgi:hypothetical protein